MSCPRCGTDNKASLAGEALSLFERLDAEPWSSRARRIAGGATVGGAR